MTKIRTLTHLQDHLDRDFGWRIKEIANLKVNLRQPKSLSGPTLVRAGVTLLYAHWEGFIKSSALAYLDYINNQKINYEDLKSSFIAIGLKSRLNLLNESRKSKINSDTVDFVIDQMGKSAKLNLGSAINTDSNLSSQVFDNIVYTLALAPTPYESRYNLIDESLVNRRNRIAHGEYLDIKADEWRKLADDILDLMRQFKSDVQNAATLAQYKR